MRITALLFAILTAPVWAGQFSVSPIRIDFAPEARSDAITVLNSGKEPLRVAVELKRWTQDKQGTDHYEPSEDLVYFPRQLTIPAGEKRIVRIGRKATASAKESAYRLYVNEQPQPKEDSQGGQLAMVVSFGVPVFVAPAQPKPALLVQSAKVAQGKLELDLANTGNNTVRLTRAVFGEEIAVIDQFSNWYLQPEVARHYTLPLPEKACTPGRTKLTLESTAQPQIMHLDIPAGACKQ